MTWLALTVVICAPLAAIGDTGADLDVSMIDRRWDLVAAALFGLVVSILGLRRWGHQAMSSPERPVANRSSLSEPVSGPGAASAFGAGIAARRRDRRQGTGARRDSAGSAVLKLDAGQIDALSARYGGDGAASILAAIERRANAHLRGEHDKLVMLGRGEMVIMLEGLTDPAADAEMVAKRLSVDARRPVDHKGVLLFPTLSIGIAHSKVPGDIERLLAEADLALSETWGQDRIALNDAGHITKS